MTVRFHSDSDASAHGLPRSTVRGYSARCLSRFSVCWRRSAPNLFSSTRSVEPVDDKRADDEVALATELTYALVDGIVLHAEMRPGEWPPERIRAARRRHISTL